MAVKRQYANKNRCKHTKKLKLNEHKNCGYCLKKFDGPLEQEGCSICEIAVCATCESKHMLNCHGCGRTICTRCRCKGKCNCCGKKTSKLCCMCEETGVEEGESYYCINNNCSSESMCYAEMSYNHCNKCGRGCYCNSCLEAHLFFVNCK